MTQSQIHGGGGDDEADRPDAPTASGGQTQANSSGVDDILAEIDTVLETNAETFVKSFVQKGGQ